MPTVNIYGLPAWMTRERRLDLRTSIKHAISCIAALKVRETQVSVRFIHEDDPEPKDPTTFSVDVQHTDDRADAEVTRKLADSVGSLLRQYLLEWRPKAHQPTGVEGSVRFLGGHLGDAAYPKPQKQEAGGGGD